MVTLLSTQTDMKHVEIFVLRMSCVVSRRTRMSEWQGGSRQTNESRALGKVIKISVFHRGSTAVFQMKIETDDECRLLDEEVGK